MKQQRVSRPSDQCGQGGSKGQARRSSNDKYTVALSKKSEGPREHRNSKRHHVNYAIRDDVLVQSRACRSEDLDIVYGFVLWGNHTARSVVRLSAKNFDVEIRSEPFGYGRQI